MPDDLRTVYLDDHAALATAADALLGRMLGAPSHADRRDLLQRVRDDVRDDAERMAGLLGRMDARPSRVKGLAVQIAERAGRLKPNGRLRSASPLSPLVELEGLGLLLGGQRAAWSALAAVGDADASDHARRAERMEGRLREVEEARLAAAAPPLAPGDAPGV